MANPKGSPQNLRRDGAPGHKGAGGRPPEWLKAKCQKLIEKHKLFEWLASVAAGEDVEERIVYDADNNPQKIKRPADTKDRLRAFEMLTDRGWGKAVQAIEHSGGIEIESVDAKEMKKMIDNRLKELHTR